MACPSGWTSFGQSCYRPSHIEGSFSHSGCWGVCSGLAPGGRRASLACASAATRPMLELLIQGRQRSFYVGDYRWPAGDDGSFGHCPTVGSPFNANWSASSYPWGRAEGLPLDCTIVSPSSYSLHKDACASGVLHGGHPITSGVRSWMDLGRASRML